LRRVVCDIAGVGFYASGRTERGVRARRTITQVYRAQDPKTGFQQAKKRPWSGVDAAAVIRAAGGLAFYVQQVDAGRTTPRIIVVVLLRRAELEAIKIGEIDLAFRRWSQPRLRTGTKMRTAVGLVEVTAVEPIALDAITDDDARRAGAGSREELLARLEKKNAGNPVYRVGLRFAGADPRVALRENADLSDDEFAQITTRLDRLDAARGTPWTRATLALIASHPEVKAAELAEHTGRERLAFKRDVRKLKELGLTESLERGYRLSPRGRAAIARSRA
jgi:hypothetical protein